MSTSLPPPYDRGTPVPVTVTGTTPRRRTATTWVIVGVLVGALVLAVGSALVIGLRSVVDGTATSSPQRARPAEPMPSTDPTLARYYDQDLDWQPCGNGFECAELTVPLDYAAPQGETIEVAVTRVPSEGEAVGSLVINPGGPGASGVEYAQAAQNVFTAPVLESYDIVGFDPRGVAGSTPLQCLDTAQTDELVAADPDPDDKAERDELDRQIREFGEGCLRESGDLARHVSTREVVRDLDVLRQALGESRLDYFGASYGTLIGATYADTFPTHVGRMVLDGAVDPGLSNEDTSLQQAAGFEEALRAFLADCLDRDDCPLDGSVDEAARQVRDLLDSVEEQPLPTGGDRELESGNAVLGIWMPLYADFLWPDLRAALRRALDGDGSGLMRLSDAYVSRGSDRYTDNSLEALYAVNCLDHSDSIPTEEVPQYFGEFERVSPTFGRAFAFSLSTCANWPIKSGQDTKAMSADGAPPIVVIGTTRDPATPLRWAEAMASQLSSGRLIVRDGDGHTGYNQGNQCVDGAVEDFLISGEEPEDGLQC